MKMSLRAEKERGLTLVELLVVIAVIAVMATIFLSGLIDRKDRAWRIQCVNNLKEAGLAFRVWESDQVGTLPMERSVTNYGTMEFCCGLNAFRHFQVISNELKTPKSLFCPADTDLARVRATTFNLKPLPGEIPFTSNSNLSYFVGLDAIETDPSAILSGDRNITNGTPLKNGVLELTANYPATWTSAMHNKVGNILLADGGVQQLRTLYATSASTNGTVFTNRLLMPVLGQ